MLWGFGIRVQAAQAQESGFRLIGLGCSVSDLENTGNPNPLNLEALEARCPLNPKTLRAPKTKVAMRSLGFRV